MYQMKLPVNMKYFIGKWEILLSAMILFISFRNNKAWLQPTGKEYFTQACKNLGLDLKQ